jgi:hypothetical protein
VAVGKSGSGRKMGKLVVKSGNGSGRVAVEYSGSGRGRVAVAGWQWQNEWFL